MLFAPRQDLPVLGISDRLPQKKEHHSRRPFSLFPLPSQTTSPANSIATHFSVPAANDRALSPPSSIVVALFPTPLRFSRRPAAQPHFSRQASRYVRTLPPGNFFLNSRTHTNSISPTTLHLQQRRTVCNLTSQATKLTRPDPGNVLASPVRPRPRASLTTRAAPRPF